jgi:hypothetical protein
MVRSSVAVTRSVPVARDYVHGCVRVNQFVVQIIRRDVMIARRHFFGTMLLGALGVGAPVGAPGEAVLEQLSDRTAQDLVQALKDIRGAMEAQRGFPEIAGLRQKQIDFLRANGKFPDFIEVGVDVWFNVYDWHVRHLQPISVARDVSGRFTIILVSTTVILRPDTVPGFVGAPYDNR